MEGSLRDINALTAAGRRSEEVGSESYAVHCSAAKSLETTITEFRVGQGSRHEAALCISAPATKYEKLSEEQQKVLKELQREQAQA
jgi:hypothetical protein